MEKTKNAEIVAKFYYADDREDVKEILREIVLLFIGREVEKICQSS